MFSCSFPIIRKKKSKEVIMEDKKIINRTKTFSVIVNNNIQNTVVRKSFENLEIKNTIVFKLRFVFLDK